MRFLLVRAIVNEEVSTARQGLGLCFVLCDHATALILHKKIAQTLTPDPTSGMCRAEHACRPLTTGICSKAVCSIHITEEIVIDLRDRHRPASARTKTVSVTSSKWVLRTRPVCKARGYQYCSGRFRARQLHLLEWYPRQVDISSCTAMRTSPKTSFI